MDKKQQAHEYALKMIENLENCDRYVGGPDVKNIARNAWDLVGEMDQEYLTRYRSELVEKDLSDTDMEGEWG